MNLLRKYILSKLLHTNRFTFGSALNAQNDNQMVENRQGVYADLQVSAQRSREEDKTDYNAQYQIAELFESMPVTGLDAKDFQFLLKNLSDLDEQKQQYVAQADWNQVAPHLVISNQAFISKNNRLQFAKEKLKQYENVLAPKLKQKLEQRIYDENFYKSRQAQLFMRKLNPVSENYLKQGYHLLNQHSLMKLIEFKKHKLIRQLLSYNTFEENPVVDFSIASFIIKSYLADHRNQYLLNLLVYNQYFFDSPITTLVQQAYSEKIQIFAEIQELIYNSRHLNKLRLLWSYHKLYMIGDMNYSKDILAELYKTYIKTEENQEAVKKQIYSILHGHYQKILLQKFFNSLLKQINNYKDFVQVYAISLILLSKLRSIKKILPQNSSNELHPVFQMIELNLPKETSQILLQNIIQLLSNQNHSRIEYENFKRSYNYWLRDYTQPEKTIYHSQLSKLLQKDEKPLIIYYQSYLNTEEYAKTILQINRSKVQPKPIHKTKQIDVINNILRRNYEPVLNNFITTFHFGGNTQLSKRFSAKLQYTDKNLQFRNKQEESLYKLTLAHDIFLNESLPKPLSSVDLQQNQKENYYNTAIFSNQQIQFDDDLQNFQVQYKLDMGQKIIQDLQIQEDYYPEGQKPQAIKDAGQQIDEQVVQAEGVQLQAQPGEVVEAQAQVLQSEVAIQQQRGQNQQQEQLREVRSGNSLVEAQFFLSYMFTPNEIKEIFQKQQPVYRADFVSQDSEFQSQNSHSEDSNYFQFNTKAQSNQQISFSTSNNQIQMKQPKGKFFRKAQPINQEAQNQDQDLEKVQEKVEEKKDYFKNRNKNITNKNKNQFSTVNSMEKVDQTPDNMFTLEKINELKTQPIDKSFLKLLKQQEHIPSIGSGTTIAKYLFLHGKSQKNMTVALNKTLNIEFTSVIGTHSKNYQKYLLNNLYNYALEDRFYQDLLNVQLQSYNRLQFKQIITHIIHFKSEINDSMVEDICKIVLKERIGYTFVEIAHLLKQNRFRLSKISLATIARTWQKFDILNEDLLNFIREYCRKYELTIERQYYEIFCRSLIKTKKFDKLQLIISTILVEIQPKSFKLESHMINLKRQQITVLQKQWKAKEEEKYIKKYLQIIEVMVTNLDQYVPEFYSPIFTQYRKFNPKLNEKELGYAFICYSWRRQRIQELLDILGNEPEKGTSFMYDCLLKSFLNNFEYLQDLSQKMLDATVVKNRIKLTNEQIKKSLIIFKKSSSSNAFSKFLEHCLRFQEEVSKLNEVKREMYYILNNNVQDVSVGGIFNLLDFIFNEKREKERIQYREIKLSEEEKQRKLLEIQKNVTKVTQNNGEKRQNQNQDNEGKKKKKEKQAKKEERQDGQPTKVTAQKVQSSQTKQKTKDDKKQIVSKKELKKTKKLKSAQKLNKNELVEQMISERDSSKQKHTNALQNDQEIVNQIKAQGIKNESYKRKNLKSMSSLYDAILQIAKEQQEQKVKELQKKDEKNKDTKSKGKGKGNKGDDKKDKKK